MTYLAFYNENREVTHLVQRETAIESTVTNYIEIDEATYNNLLEEMMDFKKLIKCSKSGKITVTSRYSETELQQLQTEAQSAQNKSDALRLLRDSDYMVLPDKFGQYTELQQTKIIEYRENLRNVVRGNLETLPTLSI